MASQAELERLRAALAEKEQALEAANARAAELQQQVLSLVPAKRANHYGVPSNMPPDKPSKRVDILDINELAAQAKEGQVALCRCFKSSTYPYCDGSHIQHNAATGDNIAPLVIKAGLPAEQRGLEKCAAQVSLEELHKEATGPRANNYGVPSTVPPDNPSKRLDVLDIEDLQQCVSKDGVVSLCRCFKSSRFPLCDGSHAQHNAATGDNAGPCVLKELQPPKKRANNYGVASNMPPANPSKRVDMLDIDQIAARAAEGPVSLCRCYKSSTFPYCDGSHTQHNAATGDNVGPLVVKTGLPADKRGLLFTTDVSQEELDKDVKGPRANNYGVRSTMPPDNPSKVVNLVDIEDIKQCVREKGTASFCRCYKSKMFPMCDGSHNEHNAQCGDNTGPCVFKPDVPPPEPDAGGDLKELTLEEVAKHNTVQDFWTVIHGTVYDLTEFLPKHPGGVAIMKQYAGKIADEGFDPIHPLSIIAENIPQDKVMGKITAVEGAADTKKEVKKPPMEECLNLYDMELVAHKTMKASSWGYYWTGDKDEYTKNGNQLIFRRIRLIPRVMVDVSNVNFETKLMGFASSMPLYISAAAKGGLANAEAECALSRAAVSSGIIQMAPHLGSKPLSEIAAARAEGQTHFLQLYVEKDRSASEKTVREAEALGYKALFLTVDSAGLGKRETDLRTTPGGSAPRSNAKSLRRWADDLTWKDIPWFRSITKMKLVLKGVQSGADAVLAYKAGVDGIVVSNHGGRNCDTSRPTLQVLYEVTQALKGIRYDRKKFDVYLDGGIKRGSDIFKAVALGATAVGIGRAALFGLAAYGQEGVEHTVDILKDELRNTMMFMGVNRLDEIKPEMLSGVHAVCGPDAQPVWDVSRAHVTNVVMPEDDN